MEEGRDVYLPAGWRKGAYKIRESIKYSFVSLIATHPNVRISETGLDFGFHSVDSGFQELCSILYQCNLDSGLQSLLGFRIPLAVYRIPKPRILDSFHKQNFPGFGNPNSLTLGDATARRGYSDANWPTHLSWCKA